MIRLNFRIFILLVLLQVILFQLLYYFILKTDSGQDTVLSLRGFYHRERNPWNRCSIDTNGRLGCECDLKRKGCPQNIVPNVVHYVLYNISEISFRHLLSIRSVLRNQRPDKIVIHCNCKRITGHLWDSWLMNETRIEVKTMPRLVYVFNQKIAGKTIEPWLAGDALRLYVLMSSPEGGGIFLDNDVYVVSSLAKYLRYEMTLTGKARYIGGHLIIAHREARFLRFWLDTYDSKTFLKKWFYFSLNMARLVKANPALRGLFHWVPETFKSMPMVCDMIYRHNSYDWRQHEVIHLLLRDLTWCLSIRKGQKPPQFEMKDVRTLNTSFREMAREVLYEDF